MSDVSKHDYPTPFFDGFQTLRRSGGFTRRLLDILLVTFVLPLLLVVCILVAAAIKLSEPREPIFFKARRFGQSGRPFWMFKFRTMSNDPALVACEAVIRQFDRERNFKLEMDPRVSRLGAFLRRSHLDELPQLLNVIWGDMTLVGPRPNSRPISEYETWQVERLTVRPGVTGPWQIYGDRDVNYSERFAEDIKYIRTRTAWTDVSILIQTLLHCVRGRGLA